MKTLTFSTVSGFPVDGIRRGPIPEGTPNCREWSHDLRDDTPYVVLLRITRLEFELDALGRTPAEDWPAGRDYYDVRRELDQLITEWRDREDAAALESAGYRSLAAFVRQRLDRDVDCFGRVRIEEADVAPLRAAIESDTLDCVLVTHYEGGGNTTQADDRTSVIVFMLGWTWPSHHNNGSGAGSRLAIHACLPRE